MNRETCLGKQLVDLGSIGDGCSRLLFDSLHQFGTLIDLENQLNFYLPAR